MNKLYLCNISESVEFGNELELLYSIVQTKELLEHSHVIYTGIYWQYEGGIYKLFFTKLDNEGSYKSEKIFEYTNHCVLSREENITLLEKLVKLRDKKYLANIKGGDIYVYEK